MEEDLDEEERMSSSDQDNEDGPTDDSGSLLDTEEEMSPRSP